MIGRQDVVKRVVQILLRRRKSNPCLVGDPGVGKTAIAEGLAQRIADGDVPKLLGKRAHARDGHAPVGVAEPSVEETVEILEGLREDYQDFHDVTYSDLALAAAATYGDRYVNDRFLPDKAIDLLGEAGAQKLMELESELHADLVGQDAAVAAVSRAVRRARVGMRAENKPVASFVFAGPTGVGKTFVAKTLAKTYFGAESNMVRFDMSEFMERHTVSRLLGSPPGYVGFDDGGQLTNAIRRRATRPSSTRCGRRGEPAEMRNAIKVDVNDALASNFRPEFLNRLDEIVVFDSLLRSQLGRSSAACSARSARADNDLQLSVSDALKDAIIESGAADARYGARPLRRAVQRYLEDVVAEAVLSGGADETKPIAFDYDAKTKAVVATQGRKRVYEAVVDSANFGGIEAGADAAGARGAAPATRSCAAPPPDGRVSPTSRPAAASPAPRRGRVRRSHPPRC
ncbi:ATP binding protein [Aureococcus anophagefferens]|nr:ATP binding protein [Aureococcus anophagefferens]